MEYCNLAPATLFPKRLKAKKLYSVTKSRKNTSGSLQAVILIAAVFQENLGLVMSFID